MAGAVATIAAQLRRWAHAHHGPDAVLASVTRLPGHSGITFAFDLRSGASIDRLVLRIPPAGVRRSGITALLRQVPLLQFMERQGVPVPRVRFYDEDERWFGVPYLIVDRVAGTTLGDVFNTAATVAHAEPLFRQAVAALVRIHASDWRRELRGWDAPRSLAGEIERYAPLLAKSPEPGWVKTGNRLAGALAASAPPDPPPSIVHNDFYSNNWMFDRGTLTGVLDWEGTFIGAPLLDLGWVCMMYDRPSWSPSHQARIGWSPPVGFILETYEEASGTPPVDVDWYRAFAGYRLASLTAYYLDLHRRGRRRDPIWENLAQSVPFLLERAADRVRSSLRDV